MANDVLQFVDSIASSPTVRLDLNDNTTWGAQSDDFDFSPPPLRRAINGTLLTDGSVQSASSYDNRVLHLTLELQTTTIDNGATAMQTLHRELDREANYLKWQPNTATSPVFFRTLRSSTNRITEIPGAGTFRTFAVDILAEPFALGLREDISVGTVNNDPAAGSNGLYFDVTGVKGDVATPVVIKDATSAKDFAVLGVRQHGTPSDLTHFVQCESMTLSTDTTNPGGGPDAAMSGTGTNNFVRTSFATVATMTRRLSWGPSPTAAQRLAARGNFRVFAAVRRSDATSVIQIAASTSLTAVTGTTVTVPLTTSRQLVDLGLYPMEGITPGVYGSDAPIGTVGLRLFAARVSGTGTLDWDYFLLVPADEQLLLWSFGLGFHNASDVIVDGYNEATYLDDTLGGAIFGGTVGIGGPGQTTFAAATGGYPLVKPNATNRVIFAWGTKLTGADQPLLHVKTDTGSLTVSYWPRYLYLRPATT